MAEKLFPLNFPPGMRYNGTAYQSKGRWYVGSLVRFLMGKIMPVGGWVQRTLTGATIAGTPNAMVSWQTNYGTGLSPLGKTRLVIGTTSGVYAVDENNVAYDITGAAGGGGVDWRFGVFGTYLVAVNGTGPRGAIAGTNTYYWDGITSNVLINTHAGTAGPVDVRGCVVTPERFLVLIGGAPNSTAPNLGTPQDPTGGTVLS